MDTFKHDMALQLLQKELLKQQEFQTDQMKYLAQDTRENALLDIIKEEYASHYQFMLQQKREKEAQLLQLVDYLKKSAKQANITQTLLMQSKHEKKRLLEEVDRIRREIDEMIVANNKL